MSKTIKEWLEDFDNYKDVESIRMGGGATGYELDMQTLLVAMLRTIPDSNFNEASEETLDEISKGMFNIALSMNSTHSFTRAQVFSSASIACAFWKVGPEIVVEETRKVAAVRVIVLQKEEDNTVKIRE